MFEIGNSLREARTRQGLDHAQVELATKIRAKYIRAIEDEQFDVLPSETYTKGFLRSYAEFLGLDGQLYVDEYNSRYVVGGFDEAPTRHASTRIRHDRKIERRVVMLALAGIAALTALVFAAWKFGGASPGTSTPPPTTPHRTLPLIRTLELRGVGNGTYLEVRRDSSTGKLVLQATVPAGKVERIDGTRFWLFVRRPAGVTVRLGGKSVALPARRNLRVIVTPTRTALAGG